MAFTTDSWETAIAEVQDDDVLIRGELLSSLIGRASIAETAFLVWTGRRPDPGQARVLEALWVAVMEHGISPSTTVARMMASYGVPIQVGIAAGVSTFGDYHGGANEAVAERFEELISSITVSGAGRETAIADAAAQYVRQQRAARAPIDGYGHPQHGADPRVPILLELSRECGVYGDHCLLMERIEAELATAVGRSIPANVDGVSAALLLDLGLPAKAARPVCIAARVLSLGAHFVEETEQGAKWRHVPDTNVTYTGPRKPTSSG